MQKSYTFIDKDHDCHDSVLTSDYTIVVTLRTILLSVQIRAQTHGDSWKKNPRHIRYVHIPRT